MVGRDRLGNGMPDQLVKTGTVTPGLTRLEEIRRRGRSLFQGERNPNPPSSLYLQCPRVVVEPNRIFGTWVPETGVLPSVPMVKGLFASPVMAAMAALNSSHGSFCRATRLEGFSDGMVAVTFGEIELIKGCLQQVLLQSDHLDDTELLGNFCVHVVSRGDLPRDRFGYPIFGEHVSFESIDIRERVFLTAGDARLLKQLFERVERTWFEDIANSCAPLFGGPFKAGGHLQFHEDTGLLLSRPRRPSDSDSRAAMARAKHLGALWQKRIQARALWVSTTAERSGGLAPLVRFMEENCTRRLTVQELAERIGVSAGHLHAVFRQKLGCTPLSYVAERRLDLAERLLTETQLSVAEISERCGFSEQSSLTHSLKRRRGITPLAFRRSV